jgi:hypothetical protein
LGEVPQKISYPVGEGPDEGASHEIVVTPLLNDTSDPVGETFSAQFGEEGKV